MCKWNDTKLVRVNIPADLSHTGKAYWTKKAVDSCMADMVDALNKGGILTRSCCCGHGGVGTILLQDGRVISITR